MKSLIAILSAAIILLCLAVDLSAQEKKDIKKWEITGYLGTGGRGITSGYGSTFKVPCFGLGLEYFLTPRISIEGQINYLPHIAYALPPLQNLWDFPRDRPNVILVKEDEKYRLLWDINFLFYFDITRVKRPTVKWFLTVSMGYQYDRGESTYILLETLEQYTHRYGSFWFQFLNLGAGLKINIKKKWSLRLLYKINCFYAEETRTNRLALGLGYRF